VLVRKPSRETDLQPAENKDKLMHVEVFAQAGFTGGPHGDKLVPGLNEGMESSEQGM
jgi:hypothetical protein